MSTAQDQEELLSSAHHSNSMPWNTWYTYSVDLKAQPRLLCKCLSEKNLQANPLLTCKGLEIGMQICVWDNATCKAVKNK